VIGLARKVSELQNRIALMRDALDDAAYICERVAAAPARPETSAPSYARSVAWQCRRVLAIDKARKLGAP
jgi:hypothetical protein